MTKKRYIKYWLKTADYDLEAMQGIFDAGKYDWALFVGHLALEKILKAHWVKTNKDNIPPKIHDLVRLAGESEIKLDDKGKEFLLEVNDFNLEVRYADYKMDFHKKCTKEFANEYLIKIREYYNVFKKGLE